MFQQIWSQIFRLNDVGMWLNIGLVMSIVKPTLNTRENIKTEISQQPKLIWLNAWLEGNKLDKWTPSQPSAHICACFIFHSKQFLLWSLKLPGGGGGGLLVFWGLENFLLAEIIESFDRVVGIVYM